MDQYFSFYNHVCRWNNKGLSTLSRLVGLGILETALHQALKVPVSAWKHSLPYSSAVGIILKLGKALVFFLDLQR